MRMNKCIKYGFGCVFVFMASACAVSTSMDATIEREIEATTALKEKAKMPSDAADINVVKVKEEIWLGDKSEVEYDGEPLPSNLETKDGITLISNRPITLFEIGALQECKSSGKYIAGSQISAKAVD